MTNANANPATPVAKNAPGIVLRTSAYFLDPKTIVRRPGWNPRFDMGEIDELAKSIKAQKKIDGHGLLNDLRVKRILGAKASDVAQFELVDGDRRLTAIELLIKGGEVFDKGVPAKIENKEASDMELMFRMFEANSGKAFLPIEEAHAYKRMRDGFPDATPPIKGLTIEQICKRVSRKQVHVVSSLALLEADESVQDAVKTGKVNSTTAKKIAVHARGDKDKQKELVKQAMEVGRDKTKKAALEKSIDESRRAKAARKGKVLKIRALSDSELSVMGANMAQRMIGLMKDAKMAVDADLMAWVKKDDKLALAFTFGALQALKAAAGVEVELKV